MTKIFCDIADINLIKKFNKKNIVKGFTTNPSLMRKAGAKDYSKYCKNILKITKKPISFEVFADDNKNIIKQALKIKDWGKQIYVKVPVTNSRGIFLGKVIYFMLLQLVLHQLRLSVQLSMNCFWTKESSLNLLHQNLLLFFLKGAILQ